MGYALAITVVVLILISLAAFRFFFENSEIKQGAILQKDAASLNEQGAQQLTENISHQQDMLTATTTLAEATAKRVGDLVADSVEIGFEKVAARIAAIEERQEKLTRVISNIASAIEKHGIPF